MSISVLTLLCCDTKCPLANCREVFRTFSPQFARQYLAVQAHDRQAVSVYRSNCLENKGLILLASLSWTPEILNWGRNSQADRRDNLNMRNTSGRVEEAM